MNKIINGDCIEELSKLPNNSVDLIFADPPYWMRVEGKLKRPNGKTFIGTQDEWDQFKDLKEYEAFTYMWLKECQRVLKPTGSFWVIGGMQCIYMIGNIMQKLGFWFLNDIIWHKSNPTPNFAGTRFNNSHETMIWSAKNKKSKPLFNYKTAKELNTDNIEINEFKKGKRKQMGSIWKIPICNGAERIKINGVKLHSTQKPEEILYRIITTTSKLNDVVLDPFGGTMTTAAVAKKTGRKFIIFEKNKLYCEYGKKRLQKVKRKVEKIEKGVFDIKPPKVSLEDMHNDKFINLRSKWTYLDTDIKLKPVIIDRKIKLIYNNKTLDIHTAAALMSGRNVDRLNGFKFWKLKYNGVFITLGELRDLYRKDKFNWLPK